MMITGRTTLVLFLGQLALVSGQTVTLGDKFCTCERFDEVCSEYGGGCVTSTAIGMLNAIAKFATGDGGATYDSTTSSTVERLFTCDVGGKLKQQQHDMWQGVVDYARQGVNQIILDENGQLVERIDSWGARHCINVDTTADCVNGPGRWFECSPDCAPEALDYPDPIFAGAVLRIDIYEPCNFASNLAYYRVAPQVCGPNFQMSEEVKECVRHAFSGLGAGSAVFHGSQTYMGLRADTKMADLIGFLYHQFIVDGLGNYLGRSNQNDFRRLYNLSNGRPRDRTAVQATNYVAEFLSIKREEEWGYEFDGLDVPRDMESFTTIVATVVSLVYYDNPQAVRGLLNQLASVIRGDMNQLNSFLPILLDVGQTLALPDDRRFILFRQLMGMAGKMLYAFQWQENIITTFPAGDPAENARAARLMPIAFSFFNLISGFEHVDERFQRFDGMYPGDGQCRSTQPHAKWHETSATGLLDLAYMSDCVVGIATMQNNCAHMSSLNEKERITKGEFQAVLRDEIDRLVPNFPGEGPALNTAAGLLTNQIFPLFNPVNAGASQDRIDWADVSSVSDPVFWITNIVTTITNLYQNFCSDNSQCGENQYCDFLGQAGTPLQCATALGNGQDCNIATPGSCQSGTCSVGVASGGSPRTICGQSCASFEGCNSDEWCSTTFAPRICRPRQAGGYFPCLQDSQCQSNQCAWYGECRFANGQCDRDQYMLAGICLPKLNEGAVCVENRFCLSDNCSGTIIRRCTGPSLLQSPMTSKVPLLQSP